uniref:EEF1A lysine methyltransferase 4 n=1 Tax=Elaeis guineensis var. tenera TaxID=51953 RepID=A0A8N4EXA5_ELAGV|nr:EEF1A lysine methyltransferase 4 [Elaeis guineensis]
MHRDVSLCNTYNYGDALYWDARYVEEGGASFDWYQRYSALRPFVRKFVPTSSRVLMVGCGNAVMSEDMVKDGYVDIMNIDISSVVIEMMRKKYAHVPQLTYMQMDVRDMSFFQDESFDCVIDKGTLDSLMCGTNAPLSASQMLEEVNRLLRPGGVYMLITYGDPSVRIPHLNQAGCNWKIILYIISEYRNLLSPSLILICVYDLMAKMWCLDLCLILVLSFVFSLYELFLRKPLYEECCQSIVLISLLFPKPFLDIQIRITPFIKHIVMSHF